MKKLIRPVLVTFVCYTDSFSSVVFTQVFKTYRAWTIYENKLRDNYALVESSFSGYVY